MSVWAAMIDRATAACPAITAATMTIVNVAEVSVIVFSYFEIRVFENCRIFSFESFSFLLNILKKYILFMSPK